MTPLAHLLHSAFLFAVTAQGGPKAQEGKGSTESLKKLIMEINHVAENHSSQPERKGTAPSMP